MYIRARQFQMHFHDARLRAHARARISIHTRILEFRMPHVYTRASFSIAKS